MFHPKLRKSPFYEKFRNITLFKTTVINNSLTSFPSPSVSKILRRVSTVELYSNKNLDATVAM